MTSTRAPACAGELDGKRRDAAAGPEHEHRLARHETATREQRPVRGQAGERECRGLLPREPRRLREDVRLGHGHELRVGPVARAAEDLEVRPEGRLAIAPVERRVDQHLLARVPPHARAVGAGHEGQRERVDATRRRGGRGGSTPPSSARRRPRPARAPGRARSRSGARRPRGRGLPASAERRPGLVARDVDELVAALAHRRREDHLQLGRLAEVVEGAVHDVPVDVDRVARGRAPATPPRATAPRART